MRYNTRQVPLTAALAASEDQMPDVESRIREIIAREANISPGIVQRESTLADLDIASVELVQILFLIEEEFDIYLAEGQVGVDIGSVGEVFDAVRRLVAEKPTPAADI